MKEANRGFRGIILLREPSRNNSNQSMGQEEVVQSVLLSA